jgi:hypothetical protein
MEIPVPDDSRIRTRDPLILSLEETLIRVRFGHLLLRPVGEWDELSAALTRAYENKDDQLIEQLHDPLLHSWRAVATEILANTFNRARITVTRATRPWGIAVFSVPGLKCQPLLCSVEDGQDGPMTLACGGMRLLDFDSVMAAYTQCLERLLPPAPDRPGAFAPCRAVVATNQGAGQPSDE